MQKIKHIYITQYRIYERKIFAYSVNIIKYTTDQPQCRLSCYNTMCCWETLNVGINVDGN